MTKAVVSHLLNAVRGALMGVAEVVPGVSGGTVALVVGVYDRLIISAGHVLTGLRIAVFDLPRGRGFARASREFGNVQWPLIGAILAGMVLAFVTAARVVSPFVEEHPQRAFALFFGLVLASLWVPYSRSGTWTVRDYVLALGVAGVAFVVTGLPPQNVDPHPALVFLAAAIAICALVLPGVSGSFVLLTLGLYTSTMDAVNGRDFGYIAVFGLGALAGLALFVKLLQRLLEHHHHLTLVVMTGLLAGSLRALWPWQPWSDHDRSLLAPSGDIAMTVGLMLLGVVIVATLVWFEHTRHSRTARPTPKHVKSST